jgi:hypothetical protein
VPQSCSKNERQFVDCLLRLHDYLPVHSCKASVENTRHPLKRRNYNSLQARTLIRLSGRGFGKMFLGGT